jgi:hypothetical protein
MDCEIIMRDELAERYLRHELTEREQSDYEQHFFKCSRCFGELTRLQAVQQVLLECPPISPEERPRAPTRWRLEWIIAATAAVTASVVGVALLLRGQPETEQAVHSQATGRPGVPSGQASTALTPVPPRAPERVPPSTTVATKPVPAMTPADISATLRRLAQIDAPTYRPMVLRGAIDEATTHFREGMRSYSAADYASALPALTKAAQLDPSRADISFFLGVSGLLTGDISQGRKELQRTVAMGDSPFLAEANFFLGKAHLMEGNLGSARRDLAIVAKSDSEKSRDARDLLAELERL